MNYAVVGLGFGDEGKGTIVDYLCQTEKINFVVRHNGGPQAAHNVVLPDGRAHTFAQFGSGALIGVPTLLSHYTLVEPRALEKEAAHLEELGVIKPLSRNYISEDALLLTPLHKELGRWRADQTGHGSTGWGIGEAMRYAITGGLAADSLHWPLRVKDVFDKHTFRIKLAHLDTWVMEQGDVDLNQMMAFRESFLDYRDELLRILNQCQIVNYETELQLLDQDNLVFEGAQGVLLDEWYGFHPYTTWSTTTFQNAQQLLSEAQSTKPFTKIGVIRSYYTRHGPGPFPSESKLVEIEEQHNKTETYTGNFRTGLFDEVLFKYALEIVGGIDELAMTHLDHLPLHDEFGVVAAYQRTPSTNWGEKIDRLPLGTDLGCTPGLDHQEKLTRYLETCIPIIVPHGESEMENRAKVMICSDGPTWKNKVRINSSEL
jgi:adenylosuccinate synthase